MPADAIHAERIHVALKRAIMNARYAPGTMLVIPQLAEEYATSNSPVRDALQRLVGERLVEAASGGGFRLPELSADQLRDLYVWHGQIVRLALKSSGQALRVADLSPLILALDPADTVGIADLTRELFARFAERSRNREHGLALEAAAERLHAVRMRETAIRDRVPELTAMWTSALNGREAPLREAIWAYHRRRLRRVPQLMKRADTRDVAT
ncbi:GntR family transcriptional regulator [Flavisphingomonas formosensis]|uniref:GntR family transcriptional regulator n=1 Tax=Flavisphingomonas formosensis TaxID=861534 RepID=UPI0012FBCEE3|nr:GntR family transcriptional regulator [Sphingomonas formosensis]